MFDHLLGLILLGLGISSPLTSPAVKGDSTTQEATTTSTSGHGGSGTSESGQSSWGSSGETITTTPHPSEPQTHNSSSASGKFLPGKPGGGVPLDIHIKTSGTNVIELTGSHTGPLTLRTNLEFEVEKTRTEASGSMRNKMDLFTTRLRTIKNTKKQQTVSDIQSHINELNTKRTDAMSKQLNKMTDILTYVASKGAELKGQGKDISGLDSAVTAAASAIKTAQDAVVSQAGKSYIVTISTEKNLKTDVGAVLKTLETDLLAVYKDVVSARKALSSAIRFLAQLKGEKVPEAIIK